MGVLVMDCPNTKCSATHASFAVKASYTYQIDKGYHIYWLTLACPVCAEAALVKCSSPMSYDPRQASGSIDGLAQTRILSTVPQPVTTSAPDFVDPNVARTFERANGAIKRGEAETAGMLLRKMLDSVISNKFPHTGNGMLGSKMAKLVPNTDLPESIVNWAKELKDLGNEAAHEAHEPDMAQITELRDFAELLLTYVYTLPHRLAVMRGNP